MGDKNAKLYVFLIVVVLVAGIALLLAFLLGPWTPTPVLPFIRHREVTAMTTLGAVTGLRVSVLDKYVAVFYGVPFADAPLGADRFSPPSPGTPWSGYRDASEQVRDHCLQPARSSPVDHAQGFVGGENCLHVNVFAPDDATNRSVLVILHGGEFQRGSNDDPLYDGRYMAASEDVVVFVPNYRLNVFGFLTTPFFGVPGNQGLRDQHAALEWVSKNAGAFGGNNASITLVGVDSGAVSAGLHLLMPESRNLFRRVVMQGGSPFEAAEQVPFVGPSEIQDYVAVACAHGKRPANVNYTAGDEASVRSMIECLRSAPPSNLLHDLDPFDGVNGKLFGPSYEPWGKSSVLVAGMPPFKEEGGEKGDPSQELLPSLNGTELLIGHTTNEGEFYLSELFKDWSLAQVGKWPRGFVQVFLERLVLQFFARPRLGPAWRLYFSGSGYSNADRYVQASTFLADAKVSCPSGVMADLVNRRGGVVYRYVLEAFASDLLPESDTNETENVVDERRSRTDIYHNPTHYFDAFMSLGAALAGTTKLPEKVLEQSRQLMRRWATFAKTGSPNGPDDEPWPRYDPLGRSVLRISMDSVSTLRVQEDSHCDFMMSYSRWREIAIPG